MKTGQLAITGLKYAYNECVDPNSVTFNAYPLNSFGYCDLDKKLSDAVAVFTGPKETKAADQTLTVDLTSKSLGTAYSSSGGVATVELCVRARMSKSGREIMFTENNFLVKHSIGGNFKINMKVDRKANDEVEETLQEKVDVTAYRCDDSS